MSIAEEQSVRAEGPEVVDGGDDRNRQGADPFRRPIGEEVVHVHHVGGVVLQMLQRRTPQPCRDAERRSKWIRGRALELVGPRGIEANVMTCTPESLDLGFDGAILTTRVPSGIEAVDEGDPDWNPLVSAEH